MSIEHPLKTRITRHKIISALLLSLVTLLLVLLFKGLSLNPQHVASTLLNKPAADFSAPLLQGGSWLAMSNPDRIHLSDLKGKSVILNFWASWCVSCREEALQFEAFWQRYKEEGVVVLGIAIQDTPEASLAFAKNFGKTYPLGLDDTGKIGLDYGVYGVPETFFIDKEGIIRHKETGPMSVQLLESKLALIR